MSGRTVVVEAPWYETRIMNCSFCGIMIAREYWQDDQYKGDHFCTEACAEVKRRLERESKTSGRKNTSAKRRAHG